MSDLAPPRRRPEPPGHPAVPPPPGGRRPPAPLARLDQLRLAPDTDDRMLRGLAAGIAREAGLRPAVVRAVLVVLAFAGGVGVVAYLALWVLVADEDAPATNAPPATVVQRIGLVTGVLGALLACRSLGLWFGDAVVWPVVAIAIASSLLWHRQVPTALADGVTRWRPSWPRLLLGGALGLVAIAVLVAEVDVTQLRASVLALGLGASGVVLLGGPWLSQAAAATRREREQRLVQEARSEVAAHLHDSVLQTLALIQRSPDRPARVTALARRQERELRAWLYGGADAAQPTALATMVDDLVADLEERHEVDVEAVTVGLAGLRVTGAGAPVLQLLDAAREALANAALHADVRLVDLYVERVDDGIELWVRDRGRGFDPDAVPDVRRGVRDSIRGRTERAGGRASVRSRRGEGTEVHLRHPGPLEALGLELVVPAPRDVPTSTVAGWPAPPLPEPPLTEPSTRRTP